MTLISKLERSQQIYEKINEKLSMIEHEIGLTELSFLIKCIRELYGDIHTLINSKLEWAGNHKINVSSLVYAIIFINKLKAKLVPKMANVDIKLGTSLIDKYAGEPEKLDAFIDSVELFNDIVTNANNGAAPAIMQAVQNQVLRFVKTRLIDAARNSITENQSLQQLLDAVKTNCASKLTANNILAKLKSTQQKESSELFCNNIEKLTQQLKKVYLNERIPADVADKMSTKNGVDALIAGASNKETKILLKAGTFSTIHEAIQKLQENESSPSASNSAQVMWMKKSKYNACVANNTSRGRGTNNRSYRGRRGNNHSAGRNYSNNRSGDNWRNTQREFSNNFGNRSRHSNQAATYYVQENEFQQQQIPQLQNFPQLPNQQQMVETQQNFARPDQHFLGQHPNQSSR